MNRETQYKATSGGKSHLIYQSIMVGLKLNYQKTRNFQKFHKNLPVDFFFVGTKIGQFHSKTWFSWGKRLRSTIKFHLLRLPMTSRSGYCVIFRHITEIWGHVITSFCVISYCVKIVWHYIGKHPSVILINSRHVTIWLTVVLHQTIFFSFFVRKFNYLTASCIRMNKM